ncbi:transcription elongation regulator 1-like protein [Sarcoptes scabiei]|uniref:Transcription elongation regulator 1-like protein n=1 Tax=Sarcoptes scabiei TaxID=52283 RepID=A0A131ZXF1_SARSC|nr:transcription elongation regulator 1-like protein [Sarcoptes scabiei]
MVPTIPPMIPNQFPRLGIPPMITTNRFKNPFVPTIHPAGKLEYSIGLPFSGPLSNPWIHPINQQPLFMPSGVDQINHPLLSKIDKELRLQATEWAEYKTPEGKCYYYNTKSHQSVWEKPEVLIKLEQAIEEAKQNEASLNVQKSEVSSTDNTQAAKKESVKDKSKPISSTPVSGTPWCVVWTGDDRTSLWECPAELKNRPEVDELTKAPPKEKDSTPSPTGIVNNETNANNSAQNKRSIEDYSSDENLTNKKSNVDDDLIKNQNGSNSKNEAEILAAKKRESLPLEERISLFKALLLEKEVSAFSTWEKELHKIVFDSRYLLLTSKERKQVFEQFIKERAEEERKEKRQRQKLYRQKFRELLEEAILTSSKASYSDFSQKHSKDSRFRNIEKSRDREAIFNEYILQLKKKEREDKEKQRDKNKANFLDLLKEQSFITETSNWSEIKDKIRDDQRYRAIESSTTREIIFKEYVSRLNKNISIVDKEIAESLKEKEKQERIEASLREREKEVHRELAMHFRERDKERENHLHAEHVESFNALLIDLIRSPGYSWREAKRLMKKDHRWDLVEMMDRNEMETLFENHIANLIKKKRDKFRKMLDEIKDLTLSTEWRDVRKIIKDDSRYLKFSTSDRKCEREFNDYIDEKLSIARNSFKELLKETKIITYKTKQLIEESEQHLQDIINVLQNDKRYLILENFADDRRQILINYITELHQSGPKSSNSLNDGNRKQKSS